MTAMPASDPRAVAAASITALLFLAVAGAMVVATDFRLVYPLDDTYIHLALAENILRGHYGINAGEPASPSSSILYPFVLALGLAVGLGEWTPLVVNLAAAAATAHAAVALFARAGIGAAGSGVVVAAALALVLGSALVPVALTGMEHAPQTLLALWVVRGILDPERGDITPTLAAGVVLGPLVRFELLSFAAVAIVVLAVRGRPHVALGLVVAIAATLGGFALWMQALGLPPLPSSVLAKLAPTAAHPATGPIAAIAANAAELIARPHIWLAVVLAVVIVVGAVRTADEPSRARHRRAAILAVTALGAHLALGQLGAFYRYTAYIHATLIALAIVVYAEPLARRLRHASVPSAIVAVTLLAVASVPALRWHALAPLAARTIYEQQYQMHRFVAGFYRAPVAVNDLGLVAFRNEHYVLDLWGLGSEAARRARLGGAADGWMDALVRRHGVGLAMIYDSFFSGQVPAGWRAVARLELGARRIAAADSVVTFYATTPTAAPAITAALRAFAPGLPSGVRLVVATE